jgi:hypothetical protein
MTKTYDTKCYELAKAFLADRDGAGEEHFDDLAKQIQSTVDDYLEFTCPDPGAHQVDVQ